MISYAQNAEDVVLERAFAGQQEGFYIDVGAADPNNHSVTRHFYDKGWSGLNIDPLPAWHRMLEEARPRDINLLLGVSSEPGELVLTVGAEHPGGATFDPEQGRVYAEQGMHVSEVRTEVRTLAQVCEEHVGDRVVDFLKIDCEGYERAVIEGADWRRWRPRVVLVEATEPNSQVPSHQSWEPLLERAGYLYALFDGLNRFYVRREDEALREVVAVPANYFDGYVPYHLAHAAANPPAPAQVTREEASVPDYSFHGAGMEPGRLGGLVVPVRRLLRRIQRPWFDRQVEILFELRAALDAAEARAATTEGRLAEIRLQLDELKGRLSEEEARSWDVTAISRRLAALEDAAGR